MLQSYCHFFTHAFDITFYLANFHLLRVNLTFGNDQKVDSDIGMNIFIGGGGGATSEMKCDHHIIVFIALSDKLDLEAVPKEVFALFEQ